MYAAPLPAALIRILLLISTRSTSRSAVCSRAGAELAISSFGASGHEGAAAGDISDPLIVIGAVLEMVPMTGGVGEVPPVKAAAAIIAGITRRGTMYRQYQQTNPDSSRDSAC